MSFFSWLERVLEQVLAPTPGDEESTPRRDSGQDEQPVQDTESTKRDSPTEAPTTGQRSRPTGETTPGVSSKPTSTGDQPTQVPSLKPQSRESSRSKNREGHDPSEYRAIWEVAKQVAVESDTTYSLYEYRPVVVSDGDLDAARADLEQIIEAETSGEADERDVPVAYQQLWNQTNRVLEDVEYDESLAEYHPDAVSTDRWDAAHDELEAHFETLQEKKMEAANPGSIEHQIKQTNQDMFRSRLKAIVDFEADDLSPDEICDDRQQLAEWLQIWGRWEALQRISEIEQSPAPVSNVSGVGDGLAQNLQAAGYETLGSVRSASVAELQAVDGIGTQRARTVYEAAQARPVGEIQGVGETLEEYLLGEGIRTALDITAVSRDTLTDIDGIGDHRAAEIQGRAAAWLPPRCDPPATLYSPFQPPYRSLSTATKDIDTVERALRRYSEIEPVIDQLTDSSLIAPADFALEDRLLEDLVLDPGAMSGDAADTAEPTWMEVLQRTATLVADRDGGVEVPPAVPCVLV